MEKGGKAGQLRIYVSSTDKMKETTLYEYIVFQAKRAGLAGVTVSKGIMGYGASSVIHSYRFWEMAEKVPLVIEMIDEEEKLTAFYEQILPTLEEMPNGCLITFDRIDVMLYKAGRKKLFD